MFGNVSCVFSWIERDVHTIIVATNNKQIKTEALEKEVPPLKGNPGPSYAKPLKALRSPANRKILFEILDHNALTRRYREKDWVT